MGFLKAATVSNCFVHIKRNLLRVPCDNEISIEMTIIDCILRKKE